MGSTIVHMSVPKIENSLIFKQRRFDFLKSLTFFLHNSCNNRCMLPVTVSAINACVITSMSEDMEKFFAKERPT